METVPSISNTSTQQQNEYSTSDELWIPDVIVLGPGGAKGYLELGFLLKLEEENYYSSVQEWIGCSIGSSICLLIAAGYTIPEIIDECIDVSIINDITDINIDHITESPGIFNIRTIENLIKDKIRQRFGMIPTLKQLYMATGINLKIITFNLDKYRPECLSKDTEPNLSCVEAVMMSMAIPVILRPRIYRGYVYIDGAVGDPYPILTSDDGTKKILGVYIESAEDTHYASDKNPGIFLYRCMCASMKVLRDRSIKLASDKCKHVSLKTAVKDTIGITLGDDSKHNMIRSGYKTAMIFLTKLKHPDKYKILLDDNEEIPMQGDVEENTGVLDEETTDMLRMLHRDHETTYSKPRLNDSNEDIFIDDINFGDDSPDNIAEQEEVINDIIEQNEEVVYGPIDENTLIIPLTEEIRRNINRVRRQRNKKN